MNFFKILFKDHTARFITVNFSNAKNLKASAWF